jgi:CMP-N,N'-diacetyllegionaminic acid synthase
MNSLKKSITKNKIVVLIPARGGSKRIKSKNLYMIGNRPLLAWTIDAAKKEKIIDKIYVSTDDKNISFYAKYYGADIHQREKKYSKDNSLVYKTINSFLIFLEKKKNYKPNILVVLEPTSPFREKHLIRKCINKMLKTKSDSIATFVPIKTHPHRSWFLNKNGKPIPHTKQNAWKPSQKLKPAYELDGSLYAFKIKRKINFSNGLLIGKSTSYICDSNNHVEIDNERDIRYANLIFENLNKKNI